MLKILHLSTYDKVGGAAIAASRLHIGLRKSEVDSRLLVQNKSGDCPSVIGPNSNTEKLKSIIKPGLSHIPLTLYKNRTTDTFSTQWILDPFQRQLSKGCTDIVHMHWVCSDFIRIERIAKITKPIVWTLHDMWPFTGGCHHSEDCTLYQNKCGNCPKLGSSHKHDLSRWVWNRKKKSWKNLNLTIVTPSKWLADCARSSTLFGDKRIEVIPNTIDTDIYKPIDKIFARKIFNLPENKRLILFGAMNATSDINKGFHLLQDALQKLSPEIKKTSEFVVFGAPYAENRSGHNLITHFPGRLHDDASIAMLYNACDVFIIPSIAENLPNTIMEALACGTPCIGFSIGGIPEMIDHKLNGYLAEPFDTNDLAKGIEWFFSNENHIIQLSGSARAKVKEKYSMNIITDKYKTLYSNILNRSL